MAAVGVSFTTGTATVADVLEMLAARRLDPPVAAGGLVGVRAGGAGGAGVAAAPVIVLERRSGGGAGGGKRVPVAPVGAAACGGAGDAGGGAAAGSGALVGSDPDGFVTAGPREIAGMGGGTTISVRPLPAGAVPGGITTPTSVFGFPGSGGGAPAAPGSGGGMLSHPLSISIDSPLSRSPSSDLPVLSSVPATTSDATQDAVQAKGGGEGVLSG